MSQLPLVDTIELSLILLIALALAVSSAITLRTRRERDKREQSMQRAIERIESDQRHYLTARNLGPLHEKINAVGMDVAETRTEMRTEMRATREQLRLINEYLRNR